MENNIEKRFIKKRISENEKLFNENERKIIANNINIFVKVYKLGYLDSMCKEIKTVNWIGLLLYGDFTPVWAYNLGKYQKRLILLNISLIDNLL